MSTTLTLPEAPLQKEHFLSSRTMKATVFHGRWPRSSA